MMIEKGGFLVRRLHQIWSAQLQRKFREAGYDVTSVQFAALEMIAKRERLDQTDLALRIGYDRATTGGIISRLELAGFIKRAPDPKDRRARLLTVTSKGATAAAELGKVAQQTDAELLANLSVAERDCLFSTTRLLVEEGNKLGVAPAFIAGGRSEPEARANANQTASND